jgi:hypothetical protein
MNNYNARQATPPDIHAAMHATTPSLFDIVHRIPDLVNQVCAARMKTHKIVLSCLWLSAICVAGRALACDSEAQTNAGPTGVSPEQAMAVASHLTMGMKETEAIEFLASKGLTGPQKQGCNHGWACFFPLSDGSALGLEIGLTRADPRASWDNVLRTAYIQRNGTNLSVALRSPPTTPSGESPSVLLFFTCLVGLAAALIGLASRARTFSI